MAYSILARKMILESMMTSNAPLAGVVEENQIVIADKHLRTVIVLPLKDGHRSQEVFWFNGDEYCAVFNVTLDDGLVKCSVYALEESLSCNMIAEGRGVEIPLDPWPKITEAGGAFSFPRLPL